MSETSHKRQRTLLSFIEREGALEAGSRRDYSWQKHGTLLVFRAPPKQNIPRDCPLKIAGFDLDETLITTASKRRFGRDENDWKFLLPEVSKRLKELVASGYTLVVFTNQLGIGLDKSDQRAETFKRKIERIFSSVNVPVVLLASTGDDFYRKPCPGMWNYFLETILGRDDPDMTLSFFVGDAAGRPENWKPGRRADHASADRKFAVNVGLTYLTPEQFFHDEAHMPHLPDEFIPSEILKNAKESKDWTEICRPIEAIRPSVIIFVGSPAAGKSTFYRRHLQRHGYARINQDELRSSSKCLSKLDQLLRDKASIVLDNTNPSRTSRRPYIELAKKYGARIRCFWFQSPPGLNLHLDAHRSITKGVPRLPNVAFAAFESRLDVPCKEEGFDDIVQISFFPEFDTEEEARIFKYFLT